MAVSKSNISILGAVTTTQTSSTIDLSDAYMADVYVNIVQVGTATTAASFQINVSPDGGTTYYNGPVYTAGTTASTYSWQIAVPSDATKLQLAFITQAGGTSSTITAQLSKITGV